MELKEKILIRTRLKKKVPLNFSSEILKEWLEQEEDFSFHHLFLQQLEYNPHIDPALLFHFLEKDWELRMLVAQGLRYLNKNVHDLLEVLLEDTEIAVLVATVESIGIKGYRDFCPQVLALEGRDIDLDVAIIEATGIEQSNTVAILLERFLGSRDYKICTTAMKMLPEQNPTPKMIQLLLEALADPNWSLRRIAVQTLGRLKHREGIRQMLSLVSQEEESVLEAIGDAISQISDEQILKILFKKSQELESRPGVAFILGYCSSSLVIPCLLEMTNDPEDLVRRYARKSLIRLAYEADWTLYHRGLEEKEWKSRFDIVQNLHYLQNQEKLVLIGKGLKDPYWAIGRESFRQLQKILDSTVTPYLIQCLTLPDAWIRQHACQEIGNRYLHQYRSEIEKLLRDSDGIIRKEAARVLLLMKTSLLPEN
ncbi:MAG: HEAT repeat domain-containing protein [Planctomycetota bacterium]